MAAILCDMCDGGEPPFLLVTYVGQGKTEAVGMACMADWLVGAAGGTSMMMSEDDRPGFRSAMDQVLGSSIADEAAAALRIVEDEEEAPPPGDSPAEGSQSPSESPKEVAAAFPGTKNVRKSTHGNRGRSRASRPDADPTES